MKHFDGWKITDTIILVRRKDNKQAYVVDPNNKKQLDNAIAWSNYYSESKDNSEVFVLDNKGFKVKLLSAAGSSSQGGKLSFWDCTISKDKEEFIIGINSELLLSLLLQSDFKKGTCSEDVIFARKNGNLGLLHENMPEYKQALSDAETRKDINKGKTTKWTIGHNYVTLRNNDLYLGKVYVPIKIDCEYKEQGLNVVDDVLAKAQEYYYNLKGEIEPQGLRYSFKEFTLDIDFNRSSHILTNPSDKFKTLKDVIISYEKCLDENLDGIKQNDNWECGYNLGYNISFNGNGLDKLPSRQMGNIDLGYYDEYEKDVQFLLDKNKDNVITFFNLKTKRQLANVTLSRDKSFNISLLNDVIRNMTNKVT